MRLIDADELEEEIAKINDLRTLSTKTVGMAIHRCHTIDAVEVVRGEWKPYDLKWGRSIWRCTACEEIVEVPCDMWTHKPIYDYCPNCGAKMKGSDDEML